MRLLEAGCFTTFLLGQSSSRTIIERNSFWSSSILDPGAFPDGLTSMHSSGKRERRNNMRTRRQTLVVLIYASEAKSKKRRGDEIDWKEQN